METEDIVELLNRVRERRPLVHNITNYVVMNWTANALLSLGASPVMAHAVEEVEDLVALAGSLVLNIGTLSHTWIDAMELAGRRANEKKTPVVLDPVGAGATRYRTDTALRLLRRVKVDVVRGNAGEIMALAGEHGKTRGVDSTGASETAWRRADELAEQLGCVVAVTGPVDYITNGQRRARVSNGHALMGRVTGTGCAATSIIGAFCVVEGDPLKACAAALAVYGVAGELAAEGSPGPGSYAVRLLDALASVNARAPMSRVRVDLE